MQKKLDVVIREYLERGVFSGASLAFSLYTANNVRHFFFCYGATDFQKKSFSVDEHTFFDLSSLTKPLVTILSFLALKEEGKLALEDKLSSFFPSCPHDDKKEMSLRDLLNHSSGLPAYKPYYKKLIHSPLRQRKEKIIEWILQEELEYTPGSKNLYSDLGYILLGAIIEKTTGENLEKFWRIRIISPLGIEEELCFFDNTNFLKKRCAATGKCSWSDKVLRGIVHDDNSRAMGGISGHAGLFGTIKGVSVLCENIFQQHRDVISSSFQGKHNSVTEEGRRWATGFDTPSTSSPSCGDFFSGKTIGHLGFTGTSFWMDLQRGVGVIFLSNRVLNPGDNEEIKRLRPKVHNIFMEEFRPP